MNLPYEVQCFKAQALNEISNNDKSLPFQTALRKKFDFDIDTQEYGKTRQKYLTFPKELNKDDYIRLKQKRILKNKSSFL